MVLDLDHVQLACPKNSEEAARAFYGGLLGLEEIEKPEPLRARGGCWFRVSLRQLHLGMEGPFRPATKAHPALLVADAKDAYTRLEAETCPARGTKPCPTSHASTRGTLGATVSSSCRPRPPRIER